MSPVITLTTDFGSRDWFAGVMKGVIARLAPRANVIDISHEIEPFDIAAAAFLLKNAYVYFPAGSVHVCVVDPQVGTSRRPLLLAHGDFYFAGPDNGVFSLIIGEKTRAYVIDEKRCGLDNPYGRTFDGRDVFAAAAAAIINGARPEDIASSGDLLQLTVLSDCFPRAEGGRLVGRIIYVDRFGNLITNIHLDRVKAFCGGRGDVSELDVGIEGGPRLQWCGNYESISEIGCLINSCGYLEIAANKASAAELLGIDGKKGARAVIVGL